MTLRPRGTTEDGLIAPPELRTGRAPRVATRLCLATFLLATFGTGLVDALWPRPLPELIGAERTADERMRRRANLWDGSLTRLLEHDLRLRSPVRHAIAPYYTVGLYALLGEVDASVLAGPDGWLFLANRAVPPERPDAVLTRTGAGLLAALERRLAGFGVRLVVAPIPRKAVVHAEHLPPGVDPRPGIEARLPGDLARVGVDAVDVAGAFAKVHDEPLYYRADGHWTERAELVASQAIADHAGWTVPPERRNGVARDAGPREQNQNTLRYLGIDPDHAAARLLDIPPGRAYDVFDDAGRVLEHGNPARMTRWAISGTSFTARRKVPAFLSWFAGETVWNGALQGVTLLGNVRDFFRDHRQDLPEVLALELPVHQLLGARGGGRVAPLTSDGYDFFAENPPAHTSPLEGLAMGARPERPLSVPAGRLGHTGDGAVALRLVGRPREPVLVRALFGPTRADVVWRPRLADVVLPVVTPGACDDALVLELRGHLEQAMVERAELVLEADLAHAAAVAVEAPRADARKGWTQRLVLPDGASCAEALLVVRLEASAPPTPLTVAARAREGTELELARFTGLAPDAWLVLGLDGLAGREPDALELRGVGPAPAHLAGDAVLVPPFRD